MIDKDDPIKISKDTTNKQFKLASFLILALYQNGGRGHWKDEILVRIKDLDLLEIDDNLSDSKLESDLQWTKLKLVNRGIINQTLKKGDDGYPGQGVWVLSEDSKIEKWIKKLTNIDTFETTHNEISEFVKSQDTKIDRSKDEAVPEETEEENQEKQEDILLDKIIAKYAGKEFEFEYLCTELLNRVDKDILGKKWFKTEDKGDGGVDGIGYYKMGVLKFKAILQTKIQEKKVARQKIVEFLGTIQDTNADKGIFITTSDFTKGARELAGKHNITTINGRKLARYLMDCWSDKSHELENMSTTQVRDYPTPQYSPERANARQTNIDLIKLGVPRGAELTFTKDENIKVTVVDNRTVRLADGTVTSLTDAAKGFLHKESAAVQGPLYFKYEGETLVERRKRMEQEGILKE